MLDIIKTNVVHCILRYPIQNYDNSNLIQNSMIL